MSNEHPGGLVLLALLQIWYIAQSSLLCVVVGVVILVELCFRTRANKKCSFVIRPLVGRLPWLAGGYRDRKIVQLCHSDYQLVLLCAER